MNELIQKFTVKMDEVGIEDVALVGGKNASLGEMLKYLAPKGINIPNGFIVTAEAYRFFLREGNLEDYIRGILKGLDTADVKGLALRGKKIRAAFVKAKFPENLEKEIMLRYREMEKQYGKNIDVAVRSSATAEDLPGASFAGEHETYLGIRGSKDVITAVKSAMASLFTDRAISYRVDKGFDHLKIALSVSIQKMARSDKGVAGVMFTIDTESGFRDVILINSSWGLGEMVVQGKVSPDEFLVSKKVFFESRLPIISKRLGEKTSKMIYSAGKKGLKPTKVVSTSKQEQDSFTLDEKEVVLLSKWGKAIEDHYTQKNNFWTPMDIEWAKDGITKELFIVQARPETVQAARDFSKIKEYRLLESGKEILRGASVGSKIISGKARVILNVKNIGSFKKGEILVTDMTDPDWEPIMKIASVIVTDNGGRTSHAAIVARELDIPAVVGAGNASRKMRTGSVFTVDTTGSEGIVYAGALKFEVKEHNLKTIPNPKTKVMMNIATPDTAFEKSFLPNRGVGLAREEFIIASEIGIHPLALINYPKLPATIKKQIDWRSRGWKDKKQFYVDKLAYGIAKIGLAFHPNSVIARFSDFKTNEYRSLIGGNLYEPVEENPMIGWRGASRYYDPKFLEAFKLECFAIKKVREEMGFENVIPMVPFCRTPEEGRKTLEIMRSAGLATNYSAKKHSDASRAITPVYVMCEIPSNILMASEFLEIFDGMSIGSNDLTQLTLGLDRDSGIISHVADENNSAVKKLIAAIIAKCKQKGKYIGICGQAPSDHLDFTEFLVQEGIESISLNPDSLIKTTLAIFDAENKFSKA